MLIHSCRLRNWHLPAGRLLEAVAGGWWWAVGSGQWLATGGGQRPAVSGQLAASLAGSGWLGSQAAGEVHAVSSGNNDLV